MPWGSLGVIFLVVYLVALGRTLAARTARLARVTRPEALRYQ